MPLLYISSRAYYHCFLTIKSKFTLKMSSLFSIEFNHSEKIYYSLYIVCLCCIYYHCFLTINSNFYHEKCPLCSRWN